MPPHLKRVVLLSYHVKCVQEIAMLKNWVIKLPRKSQTIKQDSST